MALEIAVLGSLAPVSRVSAVWLWTKARDVLETGLTMERSVRGGTHARQSPPRSLPSG